MSGTTVLSKEVGPDGVRRYRTRVKCVIHSHNASSPIDVSNSLINFQTSKNIKTAGHFSFALTAEKNWLNLIYPNDYVNFYVDRADGQGWTRVFFGFVDNIEESVKTESNGVPFTTYSLQCSDFQKAFEKTQIYFNPHVAARADFNGGFVGTPNIGGLALMTRGVRINGNPADLVLNVTLLLLGFGSQFVLPTVYNPRLANRIRKDRADFILNRLSEDAKRQVLDAGGYAEFLEQARQQTGAQTPTSQLIDPDSTSATQMQLAERRRFSNEVITTLGGTGSGVGTESSRGSRERGVEAYNILNTTVTGYPPSLLDIIDIFTFVERQAIDGYIIGSPMWERQGDVLSFLRFISNEVVNELFFDLRPISRNGGLTAGTDYSRDLDDVEGNAGEDGAPNGTLYLPTIVMREYPFATIDRLDLSDISLTIRQQISPGGTTITSATENLGLMHFGAIFSDQPNLPGRHVVRVPNINPEDLALGLATDAASKHLDTAVVYEKEIINSKFSRSDADHYNVFEFYSDAILGNSARFFMQDLLPIITPIHIIRHGLRVRSLTTRFGRFSLDVVNRIQPQPVAPVASQATDTAPLVPPSNAVHSPITHVPGVKGFVSQGNHWHYRRRTNTRPGAAFNGSTAITVPIGEPVWRFHNGVDFAGPVGEPVFAARDGWVVAASPARADGSGLTGFSGYGSTVIIYHDGISPEAEDGTTENGAIFTLYAHLSEIRSDLIQGSSERFNDRVSPEIAANGRYRKTRVRAGDEIGKVGRTGFRDSNMGAHLHFEVIRKLNNRVYPSMDRSLTPDILTSEGQKLSEGGWAPNSSFVSPAEPEKPDESVTRSQDPIRVFQEWGHPLPVGRNAEEVSSADPDVDVDGYPQVYTGDAAEEADDPQTPPSPAPLPPEVSEQGQTSTVQVGHVDTPTTRRQIARWALLNDHWYQHNLEYLSGTIEMRGAPEIRVGYRLDLPDRNMSFYVESVSHSWSYGKDLRTTLQVTRGQPSNPYPAYVLPALNGFTPTDTQRRTNSRLSVYFITPDPLAVRRALKLERPNYTSQFVSPSLRRSPNTNEVDSAGEDSGGSLGARYNENIQESVSITTDSVRLNLEELLAAEQSLLGGKTSTSAIQTNPQSGLEDAVVSELFPSDEQNA